MLSPILDLSDVFLGIVVLKLGRFKLLILFAT